MEEVWGNCFVSLPKINHGNKGQFLTCSQKQS